MAVNIQARKLSRQFELLDLDANGYIEQSDIQSYASRILDSAGVAPGAPQGDTLRKDGDRLWTALQRSVDLDDDQRISRAEFIGSADLPPVMTEAVRFGVASFDVVDTDGDGQISLREWIRMDQTLGVARAESEQGFRQLDADGDGFVTKDEYAQAVTEFYQSKDPMAPGNWAFGTF